MSRTNEDAEQIVEIVDLISKKWNPVVIQCLAAAEPLGFSELQDRIEGVSAKVLTDSLDDLVENDLVARHVISESPLRVEYELTPDGRELQTAMESLVEWGDRYLDPDPKPKVLVVDDDPRLVNMYTSWLEDEYDVDRAYDGEDAFRKLTDDVDVVLLDRRMPGLSGDDLLERIRNWGIDCRVIILSAVEPDVDIVDMGFDAYVVKPVVKEEIRETLTDVLAREMYDQAVQEYLVLSTKEALLRAELTAAERKRSDEYARLVARIEELAEEIEDPAETVASNERLQTVLNDES